MEVILWLNPPAKTFYEELQSLIAQGKTARNLPTYSQLLKSIDSAVVHLRENPFFGNQIPRKYLSKKLIEKYNTHKVWRVELIGYWRVLYTIAGKKNKTTVIVLEFLDHDKYNKLFGYRKK